MAFDSERQENAVSTANVRTDANDRGGDRAVIKGTAAPGSHIKRGKSRRKPRKNAPVWVLVITDALLIGVSLLVFAYFHHVRPTAEMQKQSGEILPTPVATPYIEPTASPSPVPTATPSAAPTATPVPTPTPNVSGMWGAKFYDKFTDDGMVLQDDNSYRSENISIQIDTVQENDVTYYVADIYLRDIQYFRTAFADDTFGRNRAETVDIGIENDAILALSGDYCGMRNAGVVIRNGELYRDKQDNMDVLIMYHDGSMQTFGKRELDMESVKTEGAYQSWNFGPMLLEDGQVMTSFNSKLNPKNPRSAIGYYEPGHYCFVLVDGRQKGYSEGMTLQEMSQLFYDLGCTVAYNLDGGQSAVMAFAGEEYNQPAGGGRPISDIVYIAE